MFVNSHHLQDSQTVLSSNVSFLLLNLLIESDQCLFLSEAIPATLSQNFNKANLHMTLDTENEGFEMFLFQKSLPLLKCIVYLADSNVGLMV